MDVSTLWELEFITSLGYTKIIGLMSITTIYTLNAKKNPEEDKLETIGDYFGYFMSFVFLMSLSSSFSCFVVEI